ncbi:MAG TPA: DUF2325 domain-containing protein [Azospirillum sp.]|nr:DUF2325 domain-containing protein [Azospirillum sp.]
MCERCLETSFPLTRRDRRKLWEIPRSYHCAIVGTCFTPEDMAWMCRKLRLSLAPDAREYDVHRYFVEQAGSANPAAKLMHKRLDEKFSGEVRRFARESTEEGWAALWDAALASGAVAAAYWALTSHACIPDDLRLRAYADVHMLSHLMGGENRRSLRENQDLGRRCAELEARLARAERSAAERLAEKDARIHELEAEVAQQRAAACTVREPRTPRAPGQDRLLREVTALRRRVAVERLRARTAEAEAEKLRRLIDGPAQAPRRPEVGRAVEPRDLGGQAILYVGGRPSLLPFLRAAVESRNGCLLHHDGGFEQASRCLEGLVERADVVVCPIDCVSHDACLRVKGLCRRMSKPFLPVRSAGATTFTRMLGSLGRTPGETSPAVGG